LEFPTGRNAQLYLSHSNLNSVTEVETLVFSAHGVPLMTLLLYIIYIFLAFAKTSQAWWWF